MYPKKRCAFALCPRLNCLGESHNLHTFNQDRIEKVSSQHRADLSQHFAERITLLTLMVQE